MRDHRNWTAMGIRYDPESSRSLVELFTIDASNNPIVIANWYAPTMVPRIHFGAVSLWYMGTTTTLVLGQEHTKNANVLRAETRPTPYPAKKRPAMKSGCVVAAVWRMTPRLKTRPAEAIKPQRRPSRSPKGAAVKAPKKVPAERIDTISESWDAVIL